MTELIKPHGGRLTNRVLRPERKEARLAEAREMPRVVLDAERVKEVKSIARGVLSPLKGFLTRNDVESVLSESRLTSGHAWTIPTVLDVGADPGFSAGDEVALTNGAGEPVATMQVEELFDWDKDAFAARVYGTLEDAHPGVAKTRAMQPKLAGGPIQLLDNTKETFPPVNLDPWETRVLFRERGWETVCGFQTRNAPHRGHEFLQKTVLCLVDGLFVNPVIGRKKEGDYRDAVIIDAYQALLQNYYPRDRAVMSILPYEMKYAGPKEAIHHAIIRKNFGCTHFVVGRDHAGVGDYYGSHAAIEIFDEFPDLGIAPITIHGDHFYCPTCGGIESDRTCRHGEEQGVSFSGTKIRRMIREREEPPGEIMRPEVYAAIAKHEEPFHTGGPSKAAGSPGSPAAEAPAPGAK